MSERTPLDLVFGALSDATRRDLLRTVVGRGPLTATELADGRPMTRQAVAKHLNVLTDAGLLKVQRAGRETRYEVTKRGLAPASKWLRDSDTALEKRVERQRRATVRKRA